MSIANNKGYSPSIIKQFRERIQREGKSFIINDEIDRTEESVGFFFVGEYKGNAVVFDACLYTLRLQYEVEVLEQAQEIVQEKHPDFDWEAGEENNPKAIEMFEATVTVIDEEKSVQVTEFIEFDESIDMGVGIDAALNCAEVTDAIIEKFIQDFSKGKLILDQNYRAFDVNDSF